MTLCQFNWIIQDRLFYVKWPQVISEQVIDNFKSDMHSFLLSSDVSKIHYISDLRETTHLPSLGEVKEQAALLNHDKTGWVVVLTSNNGLVKLLIQVIMRLFPIHLRFVNDLDETIVFLQNVDPTLPDLKPYRDQLDSFSGKLS
jgi:hypothetical protein